MHLNWKNGKRSGMRTGRQGGLSARGICLGLPFVWTKHSQGGGGGGDLEKNELPILASAFEM